MVTVADFFRLAAFKIQQVLLDMVDHHRKASQREQFGLGQGLGNDEYPSLGNTTYDPRKLAQIEFVGLGVDDNVTNDTVLDITALESLQPGGSMLSMYSSGSEFDVGGSDKSDIAEVHKSIYGNILIGKIEHGGQRLSLTVQTRATLRLDKRLRSHSLAGMEMIAYKQDELRHQCLWRPR